MATRIADRWRLIALLVCASPLLPASAQEPAEAQEDQFTEPLVDEVITVVGTRTERSLDEVAAKITVIDRESMDRQMVRDVADLVRYEPGITVAGTGNRFGLDGFTIRGIGGNRVLTLVDGVRTPEEFSFGPFLSARRDFVDVDSLSRVEIARGPISTLYGSDALGGVVAFTTLGPQDYVNADEPVYAEAKAGYNSADQGWVGTFTGALGNDRIGTLLTYTRREHEELDNQGRIGGTGPNREQPDPQDNQLDNLLFKGFVEVVEGHTLTATLSSYETQSETQVLSDYGTLSRGTLVNSRDADDQRNRDLVSLTYQYAGEGWLDSLRAQVYHQKSDTRQVTDETRTPPGGELQFRQRISDFEQEITGGSFQVSSGFTVGGSSHYLTMGGEYYETDNSSLRRGGTVDAATGVPVREFLPLPTRDFPNTSVEHMAIFAQNEIALLNDRLRLSPGVRWDDYSADTKADAIYFAGNPGIAEPEDYNDAKLTWKIGAVYAFTDAFSAYARYSEGFRAPPYDDVNVGFTNFIGGYKTISSPSLEAETSEGYEFGARLGGRWGSIEATYFSTDYKNFIESLAIAPAFAPAGIDPADGLQTFQSVNRASVEIDGVELRGELILGELSEMLEGFYLRGSAAYAEGDDTQTNTPINEIEPLSTVVGLSWAPASGRVGAELVWSWVDNKDEDDISGERYATSSYHLIDLLARYDFSPRVAINVGVFNLTDETYIRWADTVSIADSAPLRFSQPGRNVSATLRVSM